ncbi:SDR family oxidoreductase [Acinetobacter bereziniae]|uniref:SDR family oxidoreductase n=1 Tax=Acinetobacter TaxID=469 RepID=UPI000EF73BD8|nr:MULTISPECIES: SDR family oxidoreductase [Acinetobacter]MBJ8421969.1 SDR family oxidoreductase [Acinetobacter bereziniae]MBJ9373969.1 SDR family oxidoreductase [Acinetobacter sp. TGL-Y2]MCU4474341.1 SDR family oxidoreductase [Acinetobacter bereziniae]MCU4541657.1 SDR family oxidoreductase [Acinetobacter bereziniae]MCU4626190.1 SDR family oxidoreductase [Acinetobacter bereziniae]
MSQSIFISGAAQGIGAAIARLFYQQGYQVGIYDINEVQAQALADQLGHNAKAGKLDVRDYAQWQKALAEFSEWAQGLNILVNNAGILYSGDFEKTDIQAHQSTIDINVNGVLNGCHAAFPYLKEAKFARVINLSSASAIYGQADLVSYSASKFAVRGITEGLDIEWQKYGIRVLDVMPLFVQTAMVKDMDSGAIQNIGVSLSPQDVAEQVFAQVKAKGTLFTATHRPVGLKTKVMFTLSAISPQIVNRFANLLLSKK